MANKPNAREQLALKLAKVEGRLEGLKQALSIDPNELVQAIKNTEALGEGYREALEMLGNEESPVPVRPVQAPVYVNPVAVDPAMQNAMQKFQQQQPTAPSVKPYLAQKAARVAAGKR